MDLTRGLLSIGLVSLAAAGLLALGSRAPEELRKPVTSPEAEDPSHGASFTERQVARAGAYQRGRYLAFALGVLVEVAALVLLTRGPGRALAEAVERVSGAWIVHAALMALAVTAVLFVAALPLSFVRGYAHPHAWGLSTQSLGGWTADSLRFLAIGSVVAVVSVAAFFSMVRWQPRSWWLWGWAAFTLLTAAVAFLWPVLVTPLFNRFVPLDDEVLARRVAALAADAGVAVDEVLVADASKRTTGENAYVAGLGGTRRLVLYDTLVRAGNDDETAFVVAHELGHEAESHVLKGIVLSSLGLLAGFAILRWLSSATGFWAWGGASSPADIRAVPLLLLFAAVASFVTLPVQNAVSRRFERRADQIALRLTADPATAVAVLRRLALANLSDLRPPAVAVVLLHSHPPIPARIRAALAGSPPAP
ncbi:MAG: M48 family metallopeptidase [Actinomycetota bacterium]